MSKNRISKKELKEDRFVSAAFEASHFVKANMIRIIAGTVAIVLLAGGTWLYVNYRVERREEASLALFKAQSVYMNGNFALAATDFDQVTKDYSGTESAVKAVFFAGDSYFKAGQLDQAKERFETARKKLSGSDPLKLNTLVGLAAVAEQQNETDAAIDLYKQALAQARYDYEKVIVMGDISRVLEAAGRNEEAIKMMDEIVEKYPESARTAQIKEHRAELAARMTSGGKS